MLWHEIIDENGGHVNESKNFTHNYTMFISYYQSNRIKIGHTSVACVFDLLKIVLHVRSCFL